MSIAPPSDIILDVAQAADPRRLQSATAKLNAMASGSGASPVDFATLLADTASARRSAPAHPAAATPAVFVPSRPGSTLPGLSPYQKFEAVLLQTFVQEMLPKDDELFGDAASADAYRGMMAEQLAAQLARSGGIGIARMIEKAHGPASPGAPQGGSAPVAAAVPSVVPPAAEGPSPPTSPDAA